MSSTATLPQISTAIDDDAERDVIGCLLIEPKLIREVSQIIGTTDIWGEPARLTFQAVVDAVAAVPDYLNTDAILRELRLVGAIERVGGIAWLKACGERIADESNAPYYAGLVKSASNRRRAIDAASRVTLAAQTGTDYEGAMRSLHDAMEHAKPIGERNQPGMIRLDTVKREQLRWLWPGRIPLGKLTVLAGDPGLGKSNVTNDIISRVTTGSGFPDAPHERCEIGSAILMNAEDDLADTIGPRMDAAGADSSRVYALQAITVAGEDMPVTLANTAALEQAIDMAHDCRVIVIDPVSAYLGKTDSHVNADVRAMLAPVSYTHLTLPTNREV